MDKLFRKMSFTICWHFVTKNQNTQLIITLLRQEKQMDQVKTKTKQKTCIVISEHPLLMLKYMCL
jgi:hypothetical protein